MASLDQPLSWSREPCPAWCAREHEEGDHPEDRYHQSEPTYVPVLASRAPSVPVTSSLEALDLVVRVCRYDGDVLTWVAIEAAEHREPRLVLSLDSARLLLRDLAEQLGRYDA